MPVGRSCISLTITILWGFIMENYIIEACKNIAGTTLQACIKQSVYAMLITASGERFFGANWMTCGDLTVCPRVTANSESGEDYHFCKDVCNQEFHAEAAAVQACQLAGASTLGATVYVVGHTYCCDGCVAGMTTAGVARAVVLDNDKKYRF